MLPTPHMLRVFPRSYCAIAAAAVIAIAIVGATVAAAAAVADPAAAADARAPREVMTPQGSIELIAAPTAAAAAAAAPSASGEVWLGLRFRLEKGWHTYWRNPGDSGGPATVRWTLPDGVTVDAPVWPIPERIAVGPLVNYGYHGDLVLPVRLRFRVTAARAKRVRIEADVRWLACKELCVSVRSRLGIDLPVTGEPPTAAREWRRLIESARRAAPRPMPPGWQAAATMDASRFILTLRLDRPATAATFFPLDESRIDDAAPQTVTADGRTLRIHLKTSDQLTGTPAVLRGVVVLPSGDGFDITAPVSSSAAPVAPVAPAAPAASGTPATPAATARRAGHISNASKASDASNASNASNARTSRRPR